ncbi:MAG: cobalamin biosynthesis protein CobD [Lachnospiraceae bacterium]|nr:cobalamin biosynthesis protein CobD [Lachnospiraceae bacterium]
MNGFVIPIMVGTGFLLDVFWGDPHWLPHPVRLMGALISRLERGIRTCLPKTEKGELLGGALLAVLTVLLSAGVPLGLLLLAARLHPYFFLALGSFMCYQLLAAKSLRTESMKVCERLEARDTEGARRAVSMIVGRDTERLSEEGIAKAAVETVAENASDGVLAPLFYMALGGPVLGFFYKAVNTMDSMVGYKNERYLYFGRAAARFDDICNFIPARLSAGLMILAGTLLGLDGKDALRIYRRDRKNHASPNSAQTESVCAGALGVELAGDAWYFGVLHKKKTIGDAKRPVVPGDIRLANRLMYGTAVLGLILFGGLSVLIYGVWTA